MACALGDRLSAYHDGEMDSAAAAEMRLHVEQCAACAAELAGMSAMSRIFAESARPRLPQMSAYRLHDAADRAMNASVLRLARTLRAVAACVLVGASLWLMESSTPGASGAAGRDVADTVQVAPPWMDVAVTATAQSSSLDATTPAAAWYLASVSNRSDDLP